MNLQSVKASENWELQRLWEQRKEIPAHLGTARERVREEVAIDQGFEGCVGVYQEEMKEKWIGSRGETMSKCTEGWKSMAYDWWGER